MRQLGIVAKEAWKFMICSGELFAQPKSLVLLEKGMTEMGTKSHSAILPISHNSKFYGFSEKKQNFVLL